jgi:hypothetical protein
MWMAVKTTTRPLARCAQAHYASVRSPTLRDGAECDNAQTFHSQCLNLSIKRAWSQHGGQPPANAHRYRVAAPHADE